MLSYCLSKQSQPLLRPVWTMPSPSLLQFQMRVRENQGVSVACGEGPAGCRTVPLSSACHCPEAMACLLCSDICGAHAYPALLTGEVTATGGCIDLALCHFCVAGLFWDQFVTAGGAGKQCLLTTNQFLIMKISNMHKSRKCFHHLFITYI